MDIRPPISSFSTTSSWVSSSDFDDKTDAGSTLTAPPNAARPPRRPRPGFEFQRAYSESTLRKTAVFEPDAAPRRQSVQGLLGGARRDTALLTLAEALHDGVPRENWLLAPLWNIADRLERLGFEAFGIERTLSEQTKTTTLLDIGLFWFTSNCTVATFATGVIGASVFDLHLHEGILIIIVVNLICVLPVAYFATFGARTGFRQMVFSRYSFGYLVTALPSLFNLLAQAGWGSVNAMIGAQTLHAATTENRLPIWAGMLILALVTLVVSTGGHRFIITYARWAWIPPTICFIILATKCPAPVVHPGLRPTREVLQWGLSFASALMGFATGWISFASDYSVRLPSRIPSWSIFVVVYTAIVVPLILVQSLGLAWASSIHAHALPLDYKSVGSYAGGLVGVACSSLGGFGSFMTILIGLSTIANNNPNLYSFALTFQTFGRWPQAVPRWFLTVIGTAIYVPIAICAAEYFSTALVTLLTILAYWSSLYIAIIIEEHVIFRRAQWRNYDFEAIGKADLLPPGMAAFAATCVGVAGAVLGMNMEWYAGPIGRLEGDLGPELALAFALVAFPPFRALERHHFRR